LFRFNPLGETGLELFSKSSSFVVSCSGVRCNNNRTKITKIKFRKIGESCFGLVAPLCRAKRWHQLFSELQQRCRTDFGLAFDLVGFILFFDCLTYRWNATAQNLFRYRLLFSRKCSECRVAVRATSAKTFGLRLRFGCR
jgi:hypothetical protein